jgi:transcriptional regulator with XRE-family HTH domain
MKIVGFHIRKLRRDKKITLRDLSKNVGVSASFLSQIEQGKASPSLVTLKNIADYLQTTVGNLVGETQPVNREPVVRHNRRNVIKNIGNDIQMFLLSHPNPYNQMEPLLFKLKKSATSGQDVYRHYGQEFVLILEGSLEINLNGEKYILKKGDSIYFNSNTPHSFKNLHKGTTEALWIVTPPTF